MSQLSDELLHANQAYADAFGGKADLALPPARHFAILTCMDARLDPATYAGLAEGDHAGGCSDGLFVKWHTPADQATSVVQDVRRTHEHSLVPKAIPIHGVIGDVKTGRLNAVAGAAIGGSAR